MCYKGGPRCKDECKRSLDIAENKKLDAEEKLKVVEENLKRKLAGEKVINEDGVSRTASGLRSEEANLLKYIAKQQAAIDAAKDEIRLSPEHIEVLRAKSEDMSLTPERRGAAKVAMEAAMEERARMIQKSKENEEIRIAVTDQMTADGFDQATIKECNPTVSNGLYHRTPKEYRARLYAATRSIKSLEKARDTELRGATTEDERLEVRNKFAPQLAEQVRDMREAERDYYSTAAGLEELKEEAKYNAREMSVEEWHARVIKYESFAHRKNEKQNDVRLRKLRRRRIMSAYKKAGKDPAAALEALKAQETKETDQGRVVPANIRSSKTGTILLTEDGFNKFHSDYEVSGFKGTLQAYALDRIKQPPHKHFHDKPLAEINEEAEKFSDGEWHRQPTHSSGLRTKRIDFKMTPLEYEALKARSRSLNTTMSSYGEPILTGRDVRQVQNDRSARSNEIKTALAAKMTAKKKS